MVKKSVGFVALINTDEGRKALLQIRDQSDSWGGACQVSAHGGLEGDETFLEGLLREIAEEMSPKVAEHIRGRQEDLVLINKVDKPEEPGKDGKKIQTYCIELDPVWLDKIDMQKFRLVGDASDIVDLSEKYKKTDKIPGNVTAMFKDEIEAVEKALDT